MEFENKFYKVDEKGGSFVVATLFNPITKETDSVVVRDYDYSDGSRDNDYWYDMPIDKAVRRVWLHHNGVILNGDLVEVVKGRKLAKGYVGRVQVIKSICDRYGRWVADYAYFEDGNRTNINNLKILEAVN